MNWFNKETKSQYIARPPEAAKEIIYLHPDTTIPRGAHLTVRSDEQALFYREGRFIGSLEAGTYQLDTANIPFLGHLLVNALTGGNHFITEIFFVALSECIVDLGRIALGGYQDQNSRNVVTVVGGGSYTVRVTDGKRLISEVGGQSRFSEGVVVEILNGRISNALRQVVGKRAMQAPILSLVSNADAENISRELLAFSRGEFTAMGVELVRILNLQLALDDESLRILREFGKQEAGLAIQSKGAKIASEEGFAEFNIIQGQRAALEGLGKGLSGGNGTMFMGMGLGGDLTRVNRPGGSRNSGAASRPAAGPVLPQQRQYYLVNGSKETGPYSARQIALLALSAGKSLEEIKIRADGDPPECISDGGGDPAITAEFMRRFSAKKPPE